MNYFSYNDYADCIENRKFYRITKVEEKIERYETKNGIVQEHSKKNKIIKILSNEWELKKFLKEFLEKTQKDAKYSIEKTSSGLKVNINNENLGFLIGYRGETLYAFQTVLSTIASKGTESRVRVVLDIEGYKAKREKALEDLAEKLEKTVIKTKKSVTLEPMQAYERKIIHAKLQNSDKVETRSIGEEPRRRVVISLKRN